jgi:hypothetical protein
LLSRLSLPSLLLAFTCTEREYFSCIHLPKNQVYSKESTINSYAWYFKPFQVNFHVLHFETFKYFSFCAIVFSSWGRSGQFAIFYIELSTPWLTCFICSSLILQGSWSDHCNLNKKKGTPPWYVKVGGHPMELVSHGLWKEKWGGVPSFIKEHKCAKFLENLEPLSTCLVWKIARTPLPVVDKNNHLSKQFFLSLFYKRKALAHVKSLLPSVKGPFFYFMLSLHLLTLSTFLRAWLLLIVV